MVMGSTIILEHRNVLPSMIIPCTIISVGLKSFGKCPSPIKCVVKVSHTTVA